MPSTQKNAGGTSRPRSNTEISGGWEHDGLDGLWWYDALRRPEEYNTVIKENDKVYASKTKIGQHWMGGLFTRKTVEKDTVLAEYIGPTMSITEANKITNNDYLMEAWTVTLRKRDGFEMWRRKVINGDPKTEPNNLAGYANYCSDEVANARFEDRSNEADPTGETNVVLVANKRIWPGKEIRVDYDRGNEQRPFRTKLKKMGIKSTELDSKEYQKKIWAYPERRA